MFQTGDDSIFAHGRPTLILARLGVAPVDVITNENGSVIDFTCNLLSLSNSIYWLSLMPDATLEVIVE